MESFLIPFVSGISEHDTLISSTEIVFVGHAVDSSCNVGILGFDNLDDFAFVSIKSICYAVKSNLASSSSGALFKVNLLLGDASLSHEANDIGLGSSFHSDLSGGVNSNAGVQNGVRDLIAELVGVTFSNRLRGKEDVVLLRLHDSLSSVLGFVGVL
jgi:hypothetical protein